VVISSLLFVIVPYPFVTYISVCSSFQENSSSIKVKPPHNSVNPSKLSKQSILKSLFVFEFLVLQLFLLSPNREIGLFLS